MVKFGTNANCKYMLAKFGTNSGGIAYVVVKFWTNTSGTTYNWPNLEIMQVAFYLAGEITQVKESIPWVRCASGNVSSNLWTEPPACDRSMIYFHLILWREPALCDDGGGQVLWCRCLHYCLKAARCQRRLFVHIKCHFFWETIFKINILKVNFNIKISIF